MSALDSAGAQVALPFLEEDFEEGGLFGDSWMFLDGETAQNDVAVQGWESDKTMEEASKLHPHLVLVLDGHYESEHWRSWWRNGVLLERWISPPPPNRSF